MTKRFLLGQLLLLWVACSAQAVVDSRLYSFEDGTVGNATTSVADSIANQTFPGTGDNAGFIWLEVAGDAARPLPPGQLMTVVNSAALTTPALESFTGNATYVDVSNGSSLDSPSLSSNVGLQFDGTGAFDDFNTAPGTRGVYVDEAAFNANEIVNNGVNTFESFTVLSQTWVRPNSASSGTEQQIYAVGFEQGGVSITDDGFWKVNYLGTGWYPGATGEVTSTVPVVFDEWTHVAVFRTGNGGTLYVNGRNVAGDLPGDQFFNQFAPLISLGADGFGTMGFNGVVDDFKISGLADGVFDIFQDLDYFDTVDTVLEINQETGDMTLKNSGSADVVFSEYSLTSANGALNADSWLSIAENYDADNGGSVDPTDNWSIVEQTNLILSETESPVNDGVALTPVTTIDLGSVWFRSPIRDLALDLTAPDGTLIDAKVLYVDANGNQVDPVLVGDLTFEGDINLADWEVFISNFGADFPGMGPAESYGFGDLDFDGDSDIDDLDLFRTAFDSVNGEGAFARMVPEPATGIAILMGAAFVLLARRARN